MSALRRHAWLIAAFVWGVAEATLFFIVPDVLVSFAAVRKGARAGLYASSAAALGASVGGAVMALWSLADPATAYAWVLKVPAISTAMGEAAWQAVARDGWFMATLMGPLSSTPFKLYAVIAPHAGASVAAFALAGFFARLPRFVLAAMGAALAKHWLEPRLGAGRLSWAMAGFWLLFYVIFFIRMPN